MESDKRFLGIDIGNTRSRASLSIVDSETGNISPLQPAISNVDDQPFLFSAVWRKGKEFHLLRNHSDVYFHENDGASTLMWNVKSEIESENETATAALEALADAIMRQVMNRFRLSSFSSKEFTRTIGIPADWELGSPKVERLTQALAGPVGDFELYPDAAAAVIGAAARDLIHTRDGEQSWLVMDCGGHTTRFSLVQKVDADFHLKVMASFSIPWGGDLVDQVILKEWFLPCYGESLGHRAYQPDLLRLLMMELKEKYSLKGISPDLDFGTVGIEDRVILKAEDWERICEPLQTQLQEFLADQRINDHKWKNVESVLLVGGSSQLNFVRHYAIERWGAQHVLLPNRPENLVAEGLALVFSSFVPSPYNPTLDEQPVLSADPLPAPVSHPAPHSERNTRYMKINKLIRDCALIGAVIALLLVWVPFGSWPFLMALEIYMLVQIGKSYGYRYTDGLFVSMALGLLVLSIGLSAVLAPLTESFLCFIKPFLAGGIVWAMGEGAKGILDWDSARQGK